jgi:hypothetical protein
MTAVLEWERLRAQRVAEVMRDLVTQGVTGADSIASVIASLPEGSDPQIRLAVYGMLAGLEIVEPPQSIATVGAFANNWGNLGSDQLLSVYRDPFGRVHWTGLPGRLSGSASNGETICTFPLKYAPREPLGFPCITDAGLIHIGLFTDGTMKWRTTGGFTGGYAYVYAHNIGSYLGSVI